MGQVEGDEVAEGVEDEEEDGGAGGDWRGRGSGVWYGVSFGGSNCKDAVVFQMTERSTW